MDYEILFMILTGWLMCLFYIHYSFEDFKTWREQPPYLKLVMFHIGLFFIACSFLLIIFILNGLGVIGSKP